MVNSSLGFNIKSPTVMEGLGLRNHQTENPFRLELSAWVAMDEG